MHCRFVLFPADHGLEQCILGGAAAIVDRQMSRSREDCPEICPFCSLGFFLPFSEIVVARLCSVSIAGIRHPVWKGAVSGSCAVGGTCCFHLSLRSQKGHCKLACYHSIAER